MRAESIKTVGETVNQQLYAPKLDKKPEEMQQQATVGQDQLIRKPLAELLKSDYDINFQLSFTFHKETEQLVVEVIDPDNGKVIRQIPPEELLELAVKLQEMIGLFLDKRV
ncbi:MAG: flagellar protein FlaG [Thermacetogeniaceae bacterium]|jgi:flagellar protein FlaG